MLNFGVLFRKRLKTIDDANIIDLTESTLNTRAQVSVIDILTVPDNFAGKPTAIAAALLGSENYADLLFSFNGYADMFRVNAGDVLVVPELSSMLACLTTPEDINKLDDTTNTNLDNYTLTEFKKKVVNRDINRLKVISQNTGVDINALDIRKPNMSTGDFFTKDGNGGIVLGTNITNTKCQQITAAQTKNELIRDAVKKQLISEFANNTTRYKGQLNYVNKQASLI